MCCHMKRIENGSPSSELQKSDGSVKLGPTAVRGVTGLRRGAPSPAKRHLDDGEA
jgi:hypothetical protein